MRKANLWAMCLLNFFSLLNYYVIAVLFAVSRRGDAFHLAQI